MNEYQNLIFLKGKDKTAEISSCVYKDGKYYVYFYNGIKEYSYLPQSIRWYSHPVEVNIQVYQPEIDGQSFAGISKVFVYDKDYVCVFGINGHKQIFPKESVRFLKSCLTDPKSANIFAYLKRLAQVTGLKTEDNKNILENHYAKIDFLRNDCILADYLHPEDVQLEVSVSDMLIYPFGFNLSQKKAVEKAMSSRLSIIEGPPGTGKTQTILNILANAVMNDHSVCIVSCNNSAIVNVEEKLRKYGLDFISAVLGSRDNRQAFINAQKSIPEVINDWYISSEESAYLKMQMTKMLDELNQMLSVQIRISSLRQELSALKTENTYYNVYSSDKTGLDIQMKSSVSLSQLLQLWVKIEFFAEAQKKIPLWFKLKNLLLYGIQFDTYRRSSDELILSIQKKYYRKKIAELELELELLESQLGNFNFTDKMKQYEIMSLKIFKGRLCEKYRANPRQIYDINDLWKKESIFVKDYPVILSTTYSATSGFHRMFDFLVMDESSQVDIVTGALALSGAKRAVIVGDQVQLPNVVTTEMVKQTDTVFMEFSVPEAYRYARQSFLSSVLELFPNAPHTLLREHYRCHPKIIEFCNQKFYHGELLILTDEKTDRMPMKVYKTVAGNHARDHLNQRQIDVIFDEIVPQQHLNVNDDSIGIITPYRVQAEAIRKRADGTGVEADTVHKFQGREKDTIIFSSVDNEITVFGDDPNLINVAVSRAINQFLLVVPSCDNYGHTNIGDLLRYIEYNNYDVLESRIYSIFDYLYKDYTHMRLAIISRSMKISKYDSENLMYSLLLELVGAAEFGKLDVVCHVKMKMLIHDMDGLNEREINYVKHPCTHVDFVIYDRLSHQPVLVIEVDGYEYHREGTKQAKRDQMKDEILHHYGIPVLRLKTNGSQEKIKIIERLREILDIDN